MSISTSLPTGVPPVRSRIAAAVFISLTIRDRSRTGPESWPSPSTSSSATGTYSTCCQRSRSDNRTSQSACSCRRTTASSMPSRRATFRSVTPC